MTALNNEGPALATPALEAKPITSNASVLHDAHVLAHDAHLKRYANIRARLALRGFELRHQDDGSLLISKWNLARVCSGLLEVEQFAQEAGCAS